jgi:hypothetical protein
VGCWARAEKTIQYNFLLIEGGRNEEERKDKSFKGSLEKKECQEFVEEIKGGKKVPHLIP